MKNAIYVFGDTLLTLSSPPKPIRNLFPKVFAWTVLLWPLLTVVAFGQNDISITKVTCKTDRAAPGQTLNHSVAVHFASNGRSANIPLHIYHDKYIRGRNLVGPVWSKVITINNGPGSFNIPAVRLKQLGTGKTYLIAKLGTDARWNANPANDIGYAIIHLYGGGVERPPKTAPERPDLVVSKLTVKEGRRRDEFVPVITVKNVGNASARPFKVRVIYNRRTEIYPTYKSLRPGGSETLMNRDLFFVGGPSVIQVDLDVQGQVQESNEKNNTEYLRYTP